MTHEDPAFFAMPTSSLMSFRNAVILATTLFMGLITLGWLDERRTTALQTAETPVAYVGHLGDWPSSPISVQEKQALSALAIGGNQPKALHCQKNEEQASCHVVYKMPDGKFQAIHHEGVWVGKETHKMTLVMDMTPFRNTKYFKPSTLSMTEEQVSQSITEMVEFMKPAVFAAVSNQASWQ